LLGCSRSTELTYFFCFCRTGVAPGRVEVDPRPGDRQGGLIPAAFELEGVALAEEMQACMEAALGRLNAFVKWVATDAVQFSMALVKSHLLEADLDPVGEGVACKLHR
jgi:hypothetical protein